MDGSVAETAKDKDCIITIRGQVRGDNYGRTLDKLDTLRDAMRAGKQKFTLDDKRYIYAQLKSFQHDYSVLQRLIDFKAQLVANYPFWRSETLNVDRRTPTSGTAFNVYNNGNASARVKIKLVAPAGGISDDIQFDNDTNSQQFKFRGDVAATEELIMDNRVDSDDDFVVTNDGDDAHQYFEGDFLTLDPGKNEIKYTGTASAVITLYWRDTWY
jgi:phage-related protein